MSNKIRVIITGATGMVGEGVLHECLLHTDVESVLVINRKACGINHPKLKEIIHADFFDLSTIRNELVGYNACFFCLGVSSIGMREPEYAKLTHTLTMHVADTLSFQNPGMSFCYVSGAGTDSTEKGRIMWARVKGKTENDLMKLPFKGVYNFRPAIIKPTRGLQNTLKLYHYFGWMMPLVQLVAPNSICSLKEVGLAMINVAINAYDKHTLEVKDIKALAKA